MFVCVYLLLIRIVLLLLLLLLLCVIDEILYEIEKLKEEQERANLAKHAQLMKDMNLVTNNPVAMKEDKPTGGPSVEVYNRIRRTNRPRADDPSPQERFEKAMKYRARRNSEKVESD